MMNFEEDGYVIIEDALSVDEIEDLKQAVDRVIGGDYSRLWNIADAIGRDEAFLHLVDHPKILPRIIEILGTNIWMNHSHLGVNPPGERGGLPIGNMGWHYDGACVDNDLSSNAPLLSVKVIYYLTDLTKPDSGQTHVIPRNIENPTIKDAFPVCVKPGTALIFDCFRLMHSVLSDNNSDITRLALFLSYAYRWIQPIDKMTVEHYRDKCNDVQRQLLGLDHDYVRILTAEGRSNRYYPQGLAIKRA